MLRHDASPWSFRRLIRERYMQPTSSHPQHHGVFTSSSDSARLHVTLYAPRMVKPRRGRARPVGRTRRFALVGDRSRLRQPMEHVFRQCLIALRSASNSARSSRSRAVLLHRAASSTWAALGCPYEQAKWFGDDIALKSTKYDHEPFSVRDASRWCAKSVGSPRRCTGSALALEFAILDTDR
jgi:hypothetical protein